MESHLNCAKTECVPFFYVELYYNMNLYHTLNNFKTFLIYAQRV